MLSLSEQIQELLKGVQALEERAKKAEQAKIESEEKTKELQKMLADVQERAEQDKAASDTKIVELQEKLKVAEKIAEDIANVSTQKVADEVKEEESITKPVPKPRNSIDKSSDSNTTKTKEAEKPKILTKKPSITKQDSEGGKKDQSDKIMEGLKKNIDNITTPETSSETVVADTIIQVAARKSIVGGVQLPQLSNVALKTTQKGQELFPYKQSSADIATDEVAVVGAEAGVVENG